MTGVKDLSNKKPKIITDKLYLGRSDQGRPTTTQFVGIITNVKLFEDDGKNNIKKMARYLCVQEAEIVTAKSKWHKHGIVKENNVDEWEVCYKNLTYKLAIPAPMDFIQGMEICNKLFSGNMVELKNIDVME